MVYAFGDFPREDALDARLPPPASKHARSGDRAHNLSVARSTLSPVELAGDPFVCIAWATQTYCPAPLGLRGAILAHWGCTQKWGMVFSRRGPHAPD